MGSGEHPSIRRRSGQYCAPFDDPSDAFQSKVVLFGESAGAVDTYVIGSLPQAPSLIQAGIAQSGGGRGLPSSGPVNEFGARWASSLNCSDVSEQVQVVNPLSLTLSGCMSSIIVTLAVECHST